VFDLLQYNPEVLFWIPTRGWRDVEIDRYIRQFIMPRRNARVLASIDPSTTWEEYCLLVKQKWSTVRIGEPQRKEKRFRCPKTFEHKTGHCAVCRDGCFKYGRVDILLKIHWAGVQPKYKDWESGSLFKEE